MAQFETWLKSDLKKPVEVVKLKGNLFSADNEGNLIGVEVMDGGSPATLSGDVQGYIIRDDNYTVFVEGTLTNNKASIVLPLSCYTVVGPISIVIKVGETTVGACTSYVYRSTTDSYVDPAHVIPTLAELLEIVDDCIAATTAANTAAGKIDNMTVAATGLTYNDSPTATVTEVDGHKHIAFGIPAGTPATIKSQTNYFQNSSSGTTIPSGEWSSTQPTTPQGSFLWVKHHIVWYDDTETDVYSVSRQGVDGSGSVASILLGSNQLSPDGSGQVTLPLDNTPTANSTNLVLSGAIQTQLAGLSARIDALDPDKGVGIFADFSLSIASNAWTLSNNLYTYDYTNIAITQRAGVEVFYDTSYRTALAGDIYYTKNTGSITFTTTKAPVGTLTGTVRVIDSVQGVVPVDHGGTGANTADDAREALNIYASTVEMSSSDSTTVGSAISTLNNKLNFVDPQIKLTSSDNMNSVDVGSYWQSGSSMPLNSPSGANNANISVVKIRSNDRLQIWRSVNTGSILYRYTSDWANGSSSNWTSWQELALNEDLTSQVSAGTSATVTGIKVVRSGKIVSVSLRATTSGAITILTGLPTAAGVGISSNQANAVIAMNDNKIIANSALSDAAVCITYICS